MPTLYVENVPKDRYEALRKLAKRNRTSISAEVLNLLERFVPSEKELANRRKVYRRILKIHNSKPLTPGPFPSTEVMIREDRAR